MVPWLPVGSPTAAAAAFQPVKRTRQIRYLPQMGIFHDYSTQRKLTNTRANR